MGPISDMVVGSSLGLGLDFLGCWLKFWRFDFFELFDVVLGILIVPTNKNNIAGLHPCQIIL